MLPFPQFPHEAMVGWWLWFPPSPPRHDSCHIQVVRADTTRFSRTTVPLCHRRSTCDAGHEVPDARRREDVRLFRAEHRAEQGERES